LCETVHTELGPRQRLVATSECEQAQPVPQL
jgi:hypothetical protein